MAGMGSMGLEGAIVRSTRRQLVISQLAVASNGPSRNPARRAFNQSAWLSVQGAQQQASAPKPEESLKTEHSPFVQKLVKIASRMMGGNMKTSKAIRVTRYMYQECANRGAGTHPESKWLYETLPLAPTYQTWFALTNLHVYLLTVRLRALEDPRRPGSSAMSRLYLKELIEHFFRDIENRMIESYGVTQTRLVSVYMRDLLAQYHGSLVGYDEGLIKSDAVLASAIWRNVFGAGAAIVQPGPTPDLSSPDSGERVRSGLNYKVPSLGTLNESMSSQHLASSAALGSSKSTSPSDPSPVLRPPSSPNASSGATASVGVVGKSELRSWIGLCHLTDWVRQEVTRMEKLDDRAIIEGDLSFGPYPTK